MFEWLSTAGIQPQLKFGYDGKPLEITLANAEGNYTIAVGGDIEGFSHLDLR